MKYSGTIFPKYLKTLQFSAFKQCNRADCSGKTLVKSLLCLEVILFRRYIRIANRSCEIGTNNVQSIESNISILDNVMFRLGQPIEHEVDQPGPLIKESQIMITLRP